MSTPMHPDDDDPRTTDADMSLIRAAQGQEPGYVLQPGDLEKLVEAAGERHREFTDLVANMTREQAEYVRRLRVDDGYSWRAVAQTCYAEWGGTWQPPSNQIMGIAICEKAASFWNEDAWSGVWN